MRAIYNHEVENHTTTLDMVPRSLADQQAWIAARSGAFAAIVGVVDDPTDGDQTGRRRVRVALAVQGPTRLQPDGRELDLRRRVRTAGHGHRAPLMERLIADARDSGFHSMIARVETSGEASLGLHRACGFELIGVEKEVGRKFGRWLDVATLQLML